MKRYQLIVFDWDGTLFDSAATIVQSMQAAARDLDLPPPDDARARHVIGLGLIDAMRHAIPELPSHRYDEMVARYRHHYLSRDHELTLFEGIVDLINNLAAREKWLAVATGKSRVGLDRALGYSGLDKVFHATRCADECPSKPAPDMLLELLDELAVDASDALMIGDTSHDLLMARNAGVDGLGVAYGAHTPDTLLQCAPQAVVHSVPELANWLATRT